MNFFSRRNQILLKELIKTDFKLRYQGSVIGYLWSILKPILLFLILYLVFVRFMRFGEAIPHFAVALLLGITIWNFFSEATNMGMLSIVSRGDLLRKVNFSKPVLIFVCKFCDDKCTKNTCMIVFVFTQIISVKNLTTLSFWLV